MPKKSKEDTISKEMSQILMKIDYRPRVTRLYVPLTRSQILRGVKQPALVYQYEAERWEVPHGALIREWLSCHGFKFDPFCRVWWTKSESSMQALLRKYCYIGK